LQGIQALLDVKRDHPSVDARKTMDMIGEILFPKEDVDVGTFTDQATPLTGKDVKYTVKIGKYDNRTDLIGLKAPITSDLAEKYNNNPWGIKVGTYQKCEKCNRIGIVGITVDRHAGEKNPVTRLYMRLKHDNMETHNIPIWKVEKLLNYEQLVQKWRSEH
jgi:hypothetical protein